MYIAIDLIIAVIIASVIINSARRGFVRSVFQLCTTIASIVVAVLFYKELSNYFYDAFIYEKTSEYVGDFLHNLAADLQSGADASEIINALPKQLIGTADLLGLSLEEIIVSHLSAESLISVDALRDSLSASIATVISNIAAFASLFFGALIVLNLLGLILDSIAKLPILNGTNRFLGFALGVAEALILGVILAKVADAACSAIGALNPGFEFTDVSENTYIARFFLSIYPW